MRRREFTAILSDEKLKTLGLVLETPFGKKRSILAESPDRVVELLEKKKDFTKGWSQ